MINLFINIQLTIHQFIVYTYMCVSGKNLKATALVLSSMSEFFFKVTRVHVLYQNIFGMFLGLCVCRCMCCRFWIHIL